MRPATLKEAYERIVAGEPREKALPEFLDTFYLAPSRDMAMATIAEEPQLTGNAQLDALAGAIADYLARLYRLPAVPEWAFGSGRFRPSPGTSLRLIPRDARISDFRQSCRVPLAQHLHRGATVTPRAQPPAVCRHGDRSNGREMIIAIDGPAASGKGTLGKRLAAHYGLRHLDTGLIYRAVAKVAARRRPCRRRSRPGGRGGPGARSRALRRGRSQGSRASAKPPRSYRRSPRCARRCWRSSGASPPRRPARCWTAATSAP